MENDNRDAKIGINFVLSSIALVLSIADFFLILLLWNSLPQDIDVNALSISITALEVVLAILAVLLAFGAFGGFWMIRAAAISAARDEAKRRIEEEAPRLLAEAQRTAGTVPAAMAKTPRMNYTRQELQEILDAATPIKDDK